jgi:8-oxo-dGTP diphosphatase
MSVQRAQLPDWATRFPQLFAPDYGAWADTDIQFSLERPPETLVSHIHLTCRTSGGIVVCGAEGRRFLPGGTRDPGEGVEDTARRELLEEAGATLKGPLRWLGARRGDHRRPEPYRPHLPHPVSYWLYAVADVTVDRPPSCPPGGEQVTDVLILPPAEAAAWLAEGEDVPVADLVRLASAMGLV